MSRKHYVQFADMFALELRMCISDGERRHVRNLIVASAGAFKRDNSRFDRARFYAACGLSEVGTAPALRLVA